MSRWSLAKILGASIILLVLVGHELGMAEAPPKDSKTVPPDPDSKTVSPDPLDIEGGRQLVQAYCARCHGLNAKGARAPDLSQRVLRHANSDAALARVVRDGVPGTGMAGFSWWPDKHIRQVVSFLQHQRRSQTPSVIPGDAPKGKKVFEKHKCATCHWTGRTGGRRGPDLSMSRGPRDYVRQAIVDPAADFDREYQQIIIVTRKRRLLEGIRLSENTFYIQFIDAYDRLHTVAKADIEDLKRADKSSMPSYVKELSSEDLQNLIAYLFSLRRK